MPFSYNEFKSKIKTDGLAKQNRFYINIAAPNVPGDLRDVHLLCNSVNVPGVAFSTQPTRTTGEVHEAPYDRNFSGCTMTFYVDKQMKVRKFFDRWMDIIQDPETRSIGYREFFESPTVKIMVLKLDEQTSYTMDLHEVFPKSIGALNLSNENNNMMTLDVTFDYKYYTTTLNESIELGNTASTLLNGKGDLISEAIKKYGDITGVDIDPINQTYAGFKQTLDGYYNDISGFQDKLVDSTGILNKYGIKVDSNIASKVSQTISKTTRGSMYGAVQKAFGGNLGVFF